MGSLDNILDLSFDPYADTPELDTQLCTIESRDQRLTDDEQTSLNDCAQT